jgi:hypothetical protein
MPTRALTIAAALMCCSCAATRDRAMTFGNTVASVQLLGAVSPSGRALACALAPLSLGGLAVYRAAGGRDYWPSGL